MPAQLARLDAPAKLEVTCEHNLILCRCYRALLERGDFQLTLHYSATLLLQGLIHLCSSRPWHDYQHNAACLSPDRQIEQHCVTESDYIQRVKRYWLAALCS
jgi:hypothetical protein